MRALLASLLVLVSASAQAQTAPQATLRITVADPSGAVIVGAHVTVQATGATTPVAPVTIDTGGRGEAAFTALEPGRYTIRVESPGFAVYEAKDVRVRAGDNKRDVKMAIAKIAESVDVRRDPRERASDPRSDAFATVLGQAEINELPDDPDEMEDALKNMAGPGAVLRINGFRGGRLPSKDQIQQIRFRRNMFAADSHEPGMVMIDITTKPGLDNWRGATSAGFRDSTLSAKNAFAPVKPDESNQRYSFSLNGPLWKQHTSLALTADGVDAFDAKTIVAATPAGLYNTSVHSPTTSMNFNARLEHALTKTQALRVEYQRNHTLNENLGVGNYDLESRGYSQDRTEDVVRGSLSGSLKKALFNDLKFQFLSQDTGYTPLSIAPAVLVLNAFNSGGAQLAGPLRTTSYMFSDDLDIAVGHHAIRAGVLLEGGQYQDEERRNATGTFTFASLDAYNAGQPTTYQVNIGNPVVHVSEVQAGFYVQDDYRAAKNLTISFGARQEIQSWFGGFNLGPRAGIAWSPTKSGKTTVRAGGGIFYDWFDAQSYARVVQLDGAHQVIRTVIDPGFPDPTQGGEAEILPPGRMQLAPTLLQPKIAEGIFGVEQQLPGNVRLNTMYIHRSGTNQMRALNINAPLPDGSRPDPTSGPIGQIGSIATSQFDGLSVNLNWVNLTPRIFIAANYMLSRSINETDDAFSFPADSYNLAAERGPALSDTRHRFMSLANFPLGHRMRLGTSIRVQSALPYNITTGHDDNGDTISNDRPAGVTRNAGRGAALVDIGARLSWTVNFGPKAPPPAGPQVRIVRGDDANPLSSMAGGAEGATTQRYTVELYVQAYNLLNRVNPLNFSGVITSPFFGQATAAAPPFRAEVGARLNF